MKINAESRVFSPAKIFAACLAVYVILTVAFYFLAGEQLRLRDSRGNIAQSAPDLGGVELVQGTVVEQAFTAEIQRLESVSVQWGTYYRPNAGTIAMELLETASGEVLMSGAFDAAAVAEGQILTIYSEEPIETVYQVPLILRVYSDSLSGSAAAPLLSSTEQEESWQLHVNGSPIEGSLCFSAAGTDYIWTGLHYWKFVIGFGVALALAFLVILERQKRGMHSYVINALIAVQKYSFLIRQLVSRDFKTKYKRSVLGMLWSFLNPLLMMIVQYFVFSTLFKSDIPNYPVYLLIGIISFNFFSEACGMALTSILGNASLITKVYMPKYIYPLTRVMSSVINLAISLIPLLIVSVVTGMRFEKSVVLALYFLVCLVIFSLGLGLLLSASMVFFRDTQFLWGVLNTIWMYATPIFYPESILPENFKFVHQVNPLYHFLKNARICVMDGISPEPVIYVQCMVIALAMLMVGALVFRKTQDRFVLYL